MVGGLDPTSCTDLLKLLDCKHGMLNTAVFTEGTRGCIEQSNGLLGKRGCCQMAVLILLNSLARMICCLLEDTLER